jgi:hypothetical protein
VPDQFRPTLARTNVIESAFSIVETVCRNVKRWRDGDQIARRVGSGLLVAERQFRKLIGHRQIPMLLSSMANAVSKKSLSGHFDNVPLWPRLKCPLPGRPLKEVGLERTAMSGRELKRLGVLARVEKAELNLVNAGEILGLELSAGEADLAAISGRGRRRANATWFSHFRASA